SALEKRGDIQKEAATGNNGRIVQADNDAFANGGHTVAATEAPAAAVEAPPAAAKDEAPKAQPLPAGEYPETREKMSGIR
ncbi:2-oxo acid dehydrogenase subunit E2, partial [Bacillus cereus]|nr:2-oxo acid dehydrogenase subunit E2 [Bacillus cereus]